MKLTVGKVFSWIIGAILLLAGAGALLQTQFLSGIFYLITGAIVLPATRETISNKLNLEFSTGMLVLVVIVGLILGGVFMEDIGGTTNNESETDTPTGDITDKNVDNTEETETIENKEEEQNYNHQLDETLKVGNIAYKVTNLRTREVIGDSYLQETASGEYVLVDLWVRNDADEPVWFTNSNIVIEDSQGREYSIDSSSFMMLENTFAFEQLQPGLEESGTLLYDVPEDQEERKLKIKPNNMFSSEDPHYVELK